jgi:magnesium-transporting ATPase (P-type)
MEHNVVYTNQIYSYMTLRKAVGWIGILLPFVLMLGVLLVFKGDIILNTISLYYYSGMRDVFVGAICSIALFLFFYKGYDKWDNRAASLAGFFAVGIALFPTVEQKPYNWVAIVHFICATSFFLILSGYSMFIFTRKEHSPSKRKLIRNKIYIICGLVMIACLVAIMVFFIFFEIDNPQSSFVFWAETLALVAFGVSWLTKGGTFYPDKHKRLKDKDKRPS